jgi:predicted butyrate kinase (DUF1464 family)
MGSKTHKTLGFDPGSSSWRITAVNDVGPMSTETVLTKEVAERPGLLRSIIEPHADGLQAIAAPSGFGLPVTTVDMVGDKELELMALKKERAVNIGLRGAIKVLKETQEETGVRCFVLPSVKHLPTVPRWRKFSLVDMGTADKVCSAACALQELAERRSTSYGQTSFVLGEAGSSFVSMVCVKGGKIVDGIGGTRASFGTRSCGALDAELAHIWEFPDKASIYSGGLVHAAGASLEVIQDNPGGTPQIELAVARFAESFASDAIAIASRNGVKSFVLSSSLGPSLDRVLTSAVRGTGMMPIEYGREASASTGAAYIANGLIGGRYRDLVEALEIRGARGSVMEDIYLSGKPSL